MIVHVYGYLKIEHPDFQDTLNTFLQCTDYQVNNLRLKSFNSHSDFTAIKFSKHFPSVTEFTDPQIIEFRDYLESLSPFTLERLDLEIEDWRIRMARDMERARHHMLPPPIPSRREITEGQMPSDMFSDGRDYPEITREDVSVEDVIARIDEHHESE